MEENNWWWIRSVSDNSLKLKLANPTLGQFCKWNFLGLNSIVECFAGINLEYACFSLISFMTDFVLSSLKNFFVLKPNRLRLENEKLLTSHF